MSDLPAWNELNRQQKLSRSIRHNLIADYAGLPRWSDLTPRVRRSSRLLYNVYKDAFDLTPYDSVSKLLLLSPERLWNYVKDNADGGGTVKVGVRLTDNGSGDAIYLGVVTIVDERGHKQTATTDINGLVTFKDVEPGFKYSFTCVAEDYYDTITDSILIDSTRTVNVKLLKSSHDPGETLDVIVRAEKRDGSGFPMIKVFKDIGERDTKHYKVTDSNGECTLRLANQEYTLYGVNDYDDYYMPNVRSEVTPSRSGEVFTLTFKRA